MVAKGIKAENVAHFNNKLVINLLLDEPLSCVELAKKTKLSHTATGHIVDRLLEMDIIRPYAGPPLKRKKGGQHFRYEINAKRAYYLCINFQQKSESFAIYDLIGGLIYTERFETEMVDNEVIDRLNAKIKSILSEKNLPLDKLAAVSVSVPGRVNEKSGAIIVSSKIDRSVNIKNKIKEAFPDSEVDVKNNIDYACIYSVLKNEFDYSAGTHLYIYVGAGMACCVINDKKIVCGANGFSGELGMNFIDNDDNRLNNALTVSTMLNYCRQITGQKDFSLSMLSTEYEKYPEIKERLKSVARILGRTVCNIVNILGASHIVFAGAITNYPKFFFDVFLEKLKDSNYSDSIDYIVDFSFSEETELGQMLLARSSSLDWIMRKY